MGNICKKDDEADIKYSFMNPRSLTYNDSEILEKFPFSEIRKYKLDNPKNIKLGHLNVNSVRNKLSSIVELVKDNIDALLISETKINSSFPSEQSAIDNYNIFCRDQNCFGGGLMFYVNEIISCRQLSPKQNYSNFEIIFLEITLRNRK